MSNFPVPPTYANPITKDEQGREVFNPIWLKWFQDVAQIFSAAGTGAGGLIDHNSLGSLQGGGAGQYYHLTSAQLTTLLSGPTQAVVTGAAGASPFVYQNVSGFTQLIVLTGGVVTDVAFSRDNITFYSAGATPTAFPLGRGDYLQITHAGAPTITRFDL